MAKIETISVTQTIKPNRICFVVDPDSKESCLKAVSINTALWGGIYNPLISYQDDSLLKIADAFSVDFIVNLSGKELPKPLQQKYERRFISEDDLTRSSSQKAGIKYLSVGYNILPIYRQIHREEIRISKEASRFSLMETTDPEWEPFVGFRFGTFSHLPEVVPSFKDWFLQSFAAKATAFDPSKESESHFDVFPPIGVTSQGISIFGNEGALSSHVVFVGDHKNLGDLIDFWTLRATGRKLLFIPLANFDKWTRHLQWLIESGSYQINRHLKNQISILKSKSISKEDFDQTCKWIVAQKMGELLIQTWFPKYLSETAHYGGDIKVMNLEIDSHEDHVFFDGENITPLKLISPHPLHSDFSSYDFNWSTELRLSDFHSRSEYTLVTPKSESVEELLQQMFLSGADTPPKIGPSGPIVYCSGNDRNLYIHPLKTFDIFRAIFNDVGLEISISDPGRYVSQMISAMGGHLHFDCRIFKIRGVRQILHYLSEGTTLTRGNMNEIFSDTKSDQFGVNWVPHLYSDLRIQNRPVVDFSTVFEILTEKRVIRPGLKFKCSTCSKVDWYHISDFDESFKCRYCFTSQRTVLKSSSEWQYKADGIFQIEKSGQGSISVIPALWRVCHEADIHNTRYIPSFHVRSRDGEINVEIDYAVIATESLSTNFRLILGEAKSYTDIQKTDRLRSVFQKLSCPTYLAFSTLKDAFSPTETATLRNLVDDKIPIIPMTRLELDPYHLYKRFEKLPTNQRYGFERFSKNLIDLNLSTSQLSPPI